VDSHATGYRLRNDRQKNNNVSEANRQCDNGAVKHEITAAYGAASYT